MLIVGVLVSEIGILRRRRPGSDPGLKHADGFRAIGRLQGRRP